MIDLLLLLLKQINLDTSIHVKNNELILHPLVDAAKYVARNCLINTKNQELLIKNGFYVFSNIRNKHDWLSDFIVLERGIITYKIVFIHHV